MDIHYTVCIAQYANKKQTPGPTMLNCLSIICLTTKLSRIFHDHWGYWQYSYLLQLRWFSTFVRWKKIIRNRVCIHNSQILSKCHKKAMKIFDVCLELDRCSSMPIYIGQYDDVADVSYQQNSADIYQQYLLIKVLRCCSAWSVWKPNLLLRLWHWLINAFALSCSIRTEPSCIIIRPLWNSPDEMFYDVTFTCRF